MEVVVVHLMLGVSEQVSDTKTNRFVVEGLHLSNLVGGHSSVETREEGLEDTLTTLQVEVHHLHVEDERDNRRTSNPTQISGASSNQKAKETNVRHDEVPKCVIDKNNLRATMKFS